MRFFCCGVYYDIISAKCYQHDMDFFSGLSPISYICVHFTSKDMVGQGPTALAVGAGGGCFGIFSLVYHFSFLSPSLWETAQYRLKYCLKGPLSPKQPTNQPAKIILTVKSIYVLLKYFTRKMFLAGIHFGQGFLLIILVSILPACVPRYDLISFWTFSSNTSLHFTREVLLALFDLSELFLSAKCSQQNSISV